MIAGSRDFDPEKLIYVAFLVQDLPLDSIVVTGGARGVDLTAEVAARIRGLKTKIFIPNWNNGKGAGFERNSDMMAIADVCYVFWDGKSHGAWDSLTKAVKKGIPTYLCGQKEYKWTRRDKHD